MALIHLALISAVVGSAIGHTVAPVQKKFEIDFNKRQASPFNDLDEEFSDHGAINGEESVLKRFDPLLKRFDPLMKRFDPFGKRFDPLMKRFDPFMKRFDPLMKRFDPLMKRFDPYMKRFDPFMKRFDVFFHQTTPSLNSPRTQQSSVRNYILRLGQEKRNIIDPRAYTLGLGR